MYSISDIMKLSQSKLNHMVFTFCSSQHDCLKTEITSMLTRCKQFKGVEKDLVPTYTYFQIKKSKFISVQNTKRYTLQLIDISAKIFYDDAKAQEEYMSLTTSTISHEMRNPLNSILSQCKLQEQKLKQLKRLLGKVSHKLAR